MRRLPWVVAALLFAVPTTARADVTPVYYNAPNSVGAMAAAPDGTIYLGLVDYGVHPPLGRLNPAQAVPGTSNGITSVPTPNDPGLSGFANFTGLAWSTTLNRVWFTRSDGMYGTSDGSTFDFKILNGMIGICGVTAGKSGGAFITECGNGPRPANIATTDRLGNRLAFVSDDLGLTEGKDLARENGTDYKAARFDAEPKGVTVAPDGTPWFAENSAGLAGFRITSWDFGNYHEYPPPCSKTSSYCSGSANDYALSDVAVSPDGAVWYTDELHKAIGKLVVGGDNAEYDLGGIDPYLAGGMPRAIRAAQDGSLWVAIQGGSNSALLRINPADRTGMVYKLGNTVAPYTLTPDSQGNVWFAGSSPSSTNLIGKLTGVVGPALGGPPTTTIPITPVSTQPPATVLTPTVSVHAEVSKPTVNNDSISANQIKKNVTFKKGKK